MNNKSDSPARPSDEDCYQAIHELFEGRSVTVEKDAVSGAGVLVLRLTGITRSWRIAVDVQSPATSKLPNCCLQDKIPLLAHVARNGQICINDGQGLSIDQDRHADVVASTVWEAYVLLESSAADASAGYTEFCNEYEGHWLQMPRLAFGRASVEVDAAARQIHVSKGRTSSDLWYFTELSGPTPPEFKLKDLYQVRGLYLPLSQGVLPPAPGQPLNAAYLNALLAVCDSSALDAWKKLLSSFSPKQSRQVRLLASFPRSAGGRSLVGLVFSVRSGRIDEREPVLPISVVRHTASYMRERGGASLEAGIKHVVVVGCGSVGSEVADALASSGIGRLTLVDNDVMSEDNVFRHALGRDHIGVHKVEGLRAELTRTYPGLKVDARPISAERWLRDADLSTVSGVVIAIGQPTLERQIAKELRDSQRCIPYVVTWLEPLDLGGHAVSLSTKGQGCFDCLFRDEGRSSLTPATAFLAAGQRITRNLTGCASVFVPYGALQSRRTALLAAERILSAMDGGALPSYAFWTGDGTAAGQAKLLTTPWWEESRHSKESDVTKRLFSMPCKTCRSDV